MSDQQRASSRTYSADRAYDALHFLKSELPHCEDMLKYLDDGRGNRFTEQLANSEIDINVTNYKIKLGKYLDINKQTGKSEECIYNSFDADWARRYYNTSSVGRNNRMTQSSTKPTFTKLPQSSCFDIAEIEEIDSSFSSITESNMSVAQNDVNKMMSTTLANSGVKVKSPEYYKRSAAEFKIKDSILT